MGAKNHASDSYGVQAGIANLSDTNYGVQVGGINLVFETLQGLQLGMIVNYCNEDSVGVQIAPLNIRAGNPWYSTAIPFFAIRTRKNKSLEERAS